LEAHAIREYEKIPEAGETPGGKEVPNSEKIVASFDDNNAHDKWLEALPALIQLSTGDSITIREKVVLKFLDELRPERTRIFLVPAVGTDGKQQNFPSIKTD
jgi:hypothetical protein